MQALAKISGVGPSFGGGFLRVEWIPQMTAVKHCA
jgi:hypothetical protein